MHIHILGICGTFMGGVALLAQKMGHQVTGSDQNVYPPMSTQLEEQGIVLMSGYSAGNLKQKPDLVVIGNALSRGNPEVEAVLDENIPYTSGAQWLSDFLLKDRWVLAVAGTHGKTTTSSMLAWILESSGHETGFLIGGIPMNFGVSSRFGNSPFFVVEADEYDTAFFDKRSKFVHYRPKTVALNNLEFDHADIFDDLDAIKRQFHHFVRTVPSSGCIVVPEQDENIEAVLSMGCWTPVEKTALGESDVAVAWRADIQSADASLFELFHHGTSVGTVNWALSGKHNVSNALSAIAMANHAGISPQQAIAALHSFQNVKRRLETRAKLNGITLYDDFAHHPTAIATTLEGLRGRVGTERIIAILEPRSNTMRMGVHKETLGQSLNLADEALIYQPEALDWSLDTVKKQSDCKVSIFTNIDDIVRHLVDTSRSGDHFLFMSNGGFGGIHKQVEEALQKA
ncbi:MAG: UDP-N-acetylmuramate:L-alanyl-gamma-D-glutamyl-meso-diaminopimelate ligase [Gammaproteobacteria bacterium]|nr:MAG: UDP-N-acetylmuramate:L-alanyl-gamma-D-glutamyl-meso-diaminopimelate ligase [Gammaproteobacteria bacterium]